VLELRKELKKIGYTLKTEKLNENKVFINIYLNKIWVYGSDANVYHKDTIKEHNQAIQIVRKYVI